ncbi:MAG: hypothetical protein ABIR66_04870, partial [Saprospiraceae bacterium]
MKKIFTIIALLGLSLLTNAQRLLTEDFNYPLGQLTLTNSGAGQNVSGGAWVWYSGTVVFIPVIAGSLSYPGYVTNPSATNDNKISLAATISSAEDAYTGFTPQPAATPITVYASFLLNVRDTTNLTNFLTTTGTPSNGEYFAGFLPSNSTSVYNSGRVYIKKGSAGNTFALGTSPAIATTTPVFYSPVDYAVGTTHLVTLAYEMVPGANNDISKIFVDAPYSATEPVPSAVSPYTAAAAAESIDVARFYFRQAVSTSATGSRTTPNADIDAIKVSTDYADATLVNPLPVTLTSFKGYLIDKNVQLNWTSENEQNVRSYTIERSTDGRNFTSINVVDAKNTAQANYIF